MNLSQMKLMSGLGAALAAVSVLGLPGVAAAQSGPHDLKGHARYLYQNGSRAVGPAYQPSRAAVPFGFAPSYRPAPAYTFAPASQPAVVAAAPATAAVPGTVAVTGPDGVVRYFPVQGAAVQQQAGLPGQPAPENPAQPGGSVQAYTGGAAPVVVPGPVCVSPGAPVLRAPCCR